ncbi:MAG: NAD(P)H-dependent oxidoreductase [Thermotogota bacterium]
MHALLIVDRDARSSLSQDLQSKVTALVEGKGHSLEILEVGSNDVVPCLGCLLCMTDRRRHGDCVIDDAVAKLNRRIGDFDLVCFLGPIAFGQFSSTIKNVTDKAKTIRMLRSRSLIAIGYGNDVRDEETATFLDVYRKHRGVADTVHTLVQERFEAFASHSLADNDAVCAELGRVL